jgi:hypothetical protein
MLNGVWAQVALARALAAAQQTGGAGGAGEAGVEKHQWVSDEAAVACLGCRQPFTALRRRHHCRVCGQVPAAIH